MLGILRTLNTKAMAIDQPIDFTIPESTVTLALYLAMPEAENSRRALNTTGCIRRAKMAGRWTGKAPKGYTNLTAANGKKYIEPKQPEADLIRWSFNQLAKGVFAADRVRKMACERGLRCESNNFWKLIRNPVYCGIITIRPNQNEEIQFVKAAHEPLISETLFYEVQHILNGNQRQKGIREPVKILFPLRGFLRCPLCHRKLTGSVSKGRRDRYPYYHCTTVACKGRFKAGLLNEAYEEELSKFSLAPQVKELYNLVLADGDIFSKKELVHERKLILRQVAEQETIISQARKFFLKEKIQLDDFNKIKKEYNNISRGLNIELGKINSKLNEPDQFEHSYGNFHSNIFRWYKNWEIEDKRNMIDLITPVHINLQNSNFGPLKLNEALSKIVRLTA
jgi:hypothetical protein